MLSHRVNETDGNNNDDNDDKDDKDDNDNDNDTTDIEPALSLLTSSYGLASRTLHTQEIAAECLIHCCTTANLHVDFNIVSQLANLGQKYLMNSNDTFNLIRGGIIIFRKMIPYHFENLNVWLVSKSNILKIILIMMTRSHLIDIRIQSLLFVKEILLAIPSTLSRSGQLRQSKLNYYYC
jgi:hypothetical protein